MIQKADIVRALFNFLQRNHAWNSNFQDDGYRRVLGWASQENSENERLLSLLHSTLNTQSQPKMESQSQFWRQVHNNKSRLSSLKEFVNFLEEVADPHDNDLTLRPRQTIWERLFIALKRQPSWGEKTSALFVKNVFNIHSRLQNLAFWRDVPVAFQKNDVIYLPVDRVINEIFGKIGYEKLGFKNINKLLRQDLGYLPNEMIIWDDLWFWGFFTQKIEASPGAESGLPVAQRKFVWNGDKYWSQISSNKADELAASLLAQEFLSIMQEVRDLR
jgi:hypothetical protein